MPTGALFAPKLPLDRHFMVAMLPVLPRRHPKDCTVYQRQFGFLGFQPGLLVVNEPI